MKKIRSISLNNISKVKRLFAKIINEYNREEIGTQRFRDFIYGLSKYAELLKSNDLENRLEKLEVISNDRGILNEH